MTFILKDKTSDNPQTTIAAMKNITYHAQEDSNSAFRAVGLGQWFTMVAGTIIAGGASSTLFPDQNTAELLTFSLTGGIAASCAYLTQTVCEIRQKLGYMQDTFSKAAEGFNNFETKMTKNLKSALNSPSEGIADIVNFKKRPISTSLAALFETAAIIAPTDLNTKMMLGYIGFQIGLNGIVLNEEYRTEQLKGTARKTREHLEFIRNLRIKSPEKLEGFDFS